MEWYWIGNLITNIGLLTFNQAFNLYNYKRTQSI